MKEQNIYLMQRIEALERENLRLNNELKKVKEVAFKVRLSDPNFDKPLKDVEVNYKF